MMRVSIVFRFLPHSHHFILDFTLDKRRVSIIAGVHRFDGAVIKVLSLFRILKIMGIRGTHIVEIKSRWVLNSIKQRRHLLNVRIILVVVYILRTLPKPIRCEFTTSDTNIPIDKNDTYEDHESPVFL